VTNTVPAVCACNGIQHISLRPLPDHDGGDWRRRILQGKRPRLQIFCRVPVVQEGRGRFPGGEYPAGSAGRRIAIAINLIRLRATGIRSLARALRKGGPPGPRKAIGAAGPWDPLRRGASPRRGQRHRGAPLRCGPPPPPATRRPAVATPAGVVTSRDLTSRDCTVDAEPTMMVRCVIGAMIRLSRPASILCPARHRRWPRRGPPSTPAGAVGVGSGYV
jgi:hypothetical protein